MGIWNLAALRELADAPQKCVHAGAAPTVSQCFREVHRKNRAKVCAVPWEECEPLRLMWRYCPGCNRFALWEYFSDGVMTQEGKARILGICWDCEHFVLRWRKTYLMGILFNPIHAPEKIIYDTELYRELAGDEIVDVGYRPDADPFRVMHYAQSQAVDRAQRHAAGVPGAQQ